MRRTRIISILVIVLSVAIIVWSLGGGMSRSRGFDFVIEGAIEGEECPDVAEWGIDKIRVEAEQDRYLIKGHATRPMVVSLAGDEVSYCSTLFIERGRIEVADGHATGTVANDARTAMRAEVDSLLWIHPEGQHSPAYERAYDSLARAYIEQNRANIYGGWLADQLSRGLPVEQAQELFEGLTSGVRRTDAVASLRERVERYGRSQVGRRVAVLPTEVEGLLQSGQYVLVDFWASWNVDDRERASRLSEITSRYAEQMSVCRISMDNSREQWQIAIGQSDEGWLQLFGADCPTEGFAIESLPVSYLLSPKGVVEVRTTSIEELAESLGELF